MPNVPQVAGVPPLNSYLAAGDVVLLTADEAVIASLVTPQWGIYLNGEPVVEADSVVSFEYKQEYTVSDYPLEQGAFESYDKVQLPFDVKIRYAQGGSESDRQTFLQSIASIIGTLNFYSVVTPEVVYPSVSVTHYDYRRTAVNGVGLIMADVWCTQIRVSATTTFSNTQQPSGASPQGNGYTAAQTPSSMVQSEFSAFNGGPGQ
jgi:hypothetical protein